jgi:hypothetical protein
MQINPRLARMIDGAYNYAAGDKSDPFTLKRAMTHIRTGVAGIRKDGEDAFYKAEPAQEERELPDGRRYSVTVYRNMQRP